MFQLGSNKRTLFAQVFLATVLTASFLYSQQDVQQENRQQLASLRNAIDRNDADAVQKIVRLSNPALLNACDEHGYTPLWYAVDWNKFDIARSLISHGADVNRGNVRGLTCLHHAAFIFPELVRMMGSRRTKTARNAAARFFVENGADVNAQDKDGRTPLHVAARCNFLNEFLIQAGADPNAQDKFGRTPLHVAAEKGNFDTVKCLVEGGAQLNAQDEKSLTPLHMAAMKGNFGAVKCLVEMGADTQLRTNNGDTPMSMALNEGHVSIVRYLFEKQKRVTAAEALKETELPAVLQKLVYDLVFDTVENNAWLSGGNPRAKIFHR